MVRLATIQRGKFTAAERVVEQSGVQERMKKAALLFVLLPLLAVAGFGQESRQDASLGVTGVFPPYVYGNTIRQYGRYGMGGLASYRYMLTPRSAVEGNYQYAQNAYSYQASFNNTRVHTRMQEILCRLRLQLQLPEVQSVPRGRHRRISFHADPGRHVDAGRQAADARSARSTARASLTRSAPVSISAPSTAASSSRLRAYFHLTTPSYNTNRWFPTLSNPVDRRRLPLLNLSSENLRHSRQSPGFGPGFSLCSQDQGHETHHLRRCGSRRQS